MKHLHIRQQQAVADRLQSERWLKALQIILEHQEDPHASSTLRSLCGVRRYVKLR